MHSDTKLIIMVSILLYSPDTLRSSPQDTVYVHVKQIILPVNRAPGHILNSAEALSGGGVDSGKPASDKVVVEIYALCYLKVAKTTAKPIIIVN